MIRANKNRSGHGRACIASARRPGPFGRLTGPSGRPAEFTPMSRRHPNTVLAAMLIAMALGYMPWYNFSALVGHIAAEFKLTAGDTGLILAAFQLGYVVVVGLTGWLADRISLRKIVFWATLLTGVSASLFTLLARDLTSVLILRLVTGLSAGAIYVPGMALLARWFPSHRRGMALGAYTGALVAAYAGGYLLASWLAASQGWRAGILWTSLPAIGAAFIVLFFVSDRQAEPEENTTAVNDQTLAPANTPRPAPEGGYAGPVLITAGYMGHMWELYAFWGWIGPFLVASALARGMSPADAVQWGGALAAGIILLGAPASWLWGVAADRIGRTYAIGLAAGLSLLAEFGLGWLYGHSLAVIVIVAGWIGFWVIADSAIFKAGLTEMVSPRHHGFSLGIQSLLGYGVTIASPLAFGWVLVWFNGPVSPTEASIWGPGFLLLGLGGLLVPVTMLLLRRLTQARLMAGGRM